MNGASGAGGASETSPVELRVPGDKSVGHRALILSSLGRPGRGVRVSGLPDAADVRSTAAALAAVGVGVDWPAGTTDATVTPPAEWTSGARIDCGNSGTTARLLCGLFAGLGLEATLDGDDSLRGRPMDRVVYPLQAMGARIDYVESDDRLPIRLAARATGHLRVLRYRSRVASAQVKSALVLAALAEGVEFEMWEPGRSRDHTERMLLHLGVPIEFGPEKDGGHLHLPARARVSLEAVDLSVPGDPSSAAFLLAAGVLSGRPVRVDGLLLNDTRTAYLEALERFGAEIELEFRETAAGEPVGSVTASPPASGSTGLRGIELGPDGMAGLIDEVPVLAVVASRAVGPTRIRGAAELRVKESDRLSAVATGLRAVGARVEEVRDGLTVFGSDDAPAAPDGASRASEPPTPPRGRVPAHGDHRIAMAFGALGVVPGAEVEVDDPSCVRVSFPGFWDALAELRGVPAP